MLLDVRDALKNPGQSYPLVRELTLEAMDVLDEQIRFDQVCLSGEFVGAGESVKISGTARAVVRAHCALCLSPLSQEIEAPVDEVFTKTLDPDNPDQYPLDGYKIDPTPVVRDALLLELPLRFLCGEDCKGLCPVCGINRNTQRCTCQEGPDGKHPFSALSGLLIDDEEV